MDTIGTNYLGLYNREVSFIVVVATVIKSKNMKDEKGCVVYGYLWRYNLVIKNCPPYHRCLLSEVPLCVGRLYYSIIVWF